MASINRHSTTGHRKPFASASSRQAVGSIKEHHWHLTKHADSTFTTEFDLAGLRSAKAWVLSFSPDEMVESPQTLRSRRIFSETQVSPTHQLMTGGFSGCGGGERWL